MALQSFKINVRGCANRGHFCRIKRHAKHDVNRLRRHIAISEEEVGGVNSIRVYRGWVY